MEYMNYRHYGIIFVCFNFLFRALYIGLSNTKVISFSTLLMAVVNIFLDYVLIFGKWGFPHMGVGGAAFASVVGCGTEGKYGNHNQHVYTSDNARYGDRFFAHPFNHNEEDEPCPERKQFLEHGRKGQFQYCFDKPAFQFVEGKEGVFVPQPTP